MNAPTVTSALLAAEGTTRAVAQGLTVEALTVEAFQGSPTPVSGDHLNRARRGVTS